MVDIEKASTQDSAVTLQMQGDWTKKERCADQM